MNDISRYILTRPEDTPFEGPLSRDAAAHSSDAGPGRMLSPVARSVAVATTAATGIALFDRDRRDAISGVTNGVVRFGRAFGWGVVVTLDYKYRSVQRNGRPYSQRLQRTERRPPQTVESAR